MREPPVTRVPVQGWKPIAWTQESCARIFGYRSGSLRLRSQDFAVRVVLLVTAQRLSAENIAALMTASCASRFGSFAGSFARRSQRRAEWSPSLEDPNQKSLALSSQWRSGLIAMRVMGNGLIAPHDHPRMTRGECKLGDGRQNLPFPDPNVRLSSPAQEPSRIGAEGQAGDIIPSVEDQERGGLDAPDHSSPRGAPSLPSSRSRAIGVPNRRPPCRTFSSQPGSNLGGDSPGFFRSQKRTA